MLRFEAFATPQVCRSNRRTEIFRAKAEKFAKNLDARRAGALAAANNFCGGEFFRQAVNRLFHAPRCGKSLFRVGLRARPGQNFAPPKSSRYNVRLLLEIQKKKLFLPEQ